MVAEKRSTIMDCARGMILIPYQTKSSGFAQRAEEMVSRNNYDRHDPESTSPAHLSHYRLGSQGGPFQPATQGSVWSGSPHI